MKTKTPGITLTGADERTDVSELAKLDAEIAILYTYSPEGRNRYPRKEWIIEALNVIPNAAIHICGRFAREELVGMQLGAIMHNVNRIQINGYVQPSELEIICGLYGYRTIITQHNETNAELLTARARNHEVLVDSSGGKGVKPERWVRPDIDGRCGYAGGLGPDNIIQELDIINELDPRPYWVDMETKLRIDGWFSLDLAREAVEKFHSVDIN